MVSQPQASQTLVLNKIADSLRPWSGESWRTWCRSAIVDTGYVRVASLPLSAERSEMKSRVRIWKAARLTSSIKPKKQKKRIPFSKRTGLSEARLRVKRLLAHKKKEKLDNVAKQS